MPYFTFKEQGVFFTLSSALDDHTPLVLIHGAGGNHLSWPPNMRHAQEYPVIALDLPGHGRSAGAGCENLSDYARAVVALLDELAIPRAVIAGHSMGGGVAQLLALKQAQRLSGLILVSTGARLTVAARILDGIHTDFAATVDLILEWAFAPDAPADLVGAARQRMLDVAPDVLYGDFVACDRFDVLKSIGNWSGPTTAICGELDRVTPPKYSRCLAGQIEDATLEIVPAAGHMVMLERAEAVGAAVDRFMGAMK
ncbi:MAG: alpha/beta fold hydrolase [Anaerolineales bacterium]|nr:alpha/beta fold hydrolase [Anaerolineales bacterium]HJO33293.1 alpha/beta fold hydrolase [Anaerolineales bacterium]